VTIQRFKINFTDGISITYKLIDDTVTTQWAELISAQTIDNVCPINHYIGYASEQLITYRINRLYELADLINLDVPDRVIKHDINQDNWRVNLHLMHIHFPDLKNDVKYSHLWNYLTEYNDIIHWLESVLINIWGQSKHQSRSSTFRVTLDFNKSTEVRVPIPENSFTMFYPLLNFGDLLLHYTHVGKNAHEMFIMKDYSCPKDQFIPQRDFNASVRMYFLDNFTPPENADMLYNAWQQFYNDKGGYDYWGYEINNPKIAFGYLKIGEIESISNMSVPKTLEELNEFRDRLVKTKVIDWEIKKGA
jgi:hypothetical protein